MAWAQPGRLTSAAGVTVYRDDLFGPEYTGNVFYNDSVYNIVGRLILEPDGVSFRGVRGPEEQRRDFLALTARKGLPAHNPARPDRRRWDEEPEPVRRRRTSDRRSAL